MKKRSPQEDLVVYTDEHRQCVGLMALATLQECGNGEFGGEGFSKDTVLRALPIIAERAFVLGAAAEAMGTTRGRSRPEDEEMPR